MIPASHPNDWGLTAAERKTIEAYITAGASSAAARLLHRSSRTVETHIERARLKAGAGEGKSAVFHMLLAYDRAMRP